MRSLWLEKLSINDFAINSDFHIFLLLKEQTYHYNNKCDDDDDGDDDDDDDDDVDDDGGRGGVRAHCWAVNWVGNNWNL